MSAPGPFKDAAAPEGTAKVTVTATTQPVDPAAQASTSQFWDYSAEEQSLPVAAGRTGTMPLTLTPTAPVGTVVHGILYVDTDTATGAANGSEITGIPYTSPSADTTAGPTAPWSARPSCPCCNARPHRSWSTSPAASPH